MLEPQPKVFVDHKVRTYEGIQATMAVGMALLESTGIRAHIDSRCRFDRDRRSLTPGMGVKAMIAPVFNLREKDPLYVVEKTHLASPVDRVFGIEDPGQLNDDALGKCLDTLAKLDLTELYRECCELCMQRFGFDSKVFHVDSTNFSVRCMRKEDPGDGTAVPRYSGHAKDRRNDLMQYSLQLITDSNRIIRYMRPYSGNAADSIMDRDTLVYIGTHFRDDLDRITVVADSKLMCMENMRLAESLGLGFVSRCPENFGGNLQDRAVSAAEAAGMTDADGISYFDTHIEALYKDGQRVVGSQRMRCIVFRRDSAVAAKVRDMERLADGVRDAFAPYTRRTASSTEEGAMRTFRSVKWEPHECITVTPRTFQVEVPDARRGGTRTMWGLGVDVGFDAERARELAEAAATVVIVTSIRRTRTDHPNPRDGMTALGVIGLYSGEYRVERSFRLLKSGMGMDSVFLQTPARENAMMFVLSIAGLLASTADAVLERAGAVLDGRDLTMYRLAREFQGTIVVYSREENSLSVLGPSDGGRDLFEYTDILGINPQLLVGYRA